MLSTLFSLFFRSILSPLSIYIFVSLSLLLSVYLSFFPLPSFRPGIGFPLGSPLFPNRTESPSHVLLNVKRGAICEAH